MLKIVSMEQVYQSCIREYMSGVNRNNRNYKTQEVFTPDWMVDLILEELPSTLDLDSVVLDRAVGDGQFASNILIKKMKHYQAAGQDIHESFVNALDTIFGIDIEPDNIALCRERLLCGCSDPEIIDLVNRRIIVGNTLEPLERIPGQTDLDHELTMQYFSEKLEHNEEVIVDSLNLPIPKQKKSSKKINKIVSNMFESFFS